MEKIGLITIVEWLYHDNLFGGAMDIDHRYIFGLGVGKNELSHLSFFRPVVIYKVINSQKEEAFRGIFETEYQLQTNGNIPTPELLYEILFTSFAPLSTDALKEKGKNTHVLNDTIPLLPFEMLKGDLEEIIQQTYRR